jgi:hypothetical protein
MPHVVRFDLSSVKKTSKTKEGFLRTDAVVTRTGIFIYHNEDGSVRRELRDHREVFNADSLDSMKMIPMTNEHPQTESKLLNPENVKQFQVGFTGENVRADGENVAIPVTVTDAEAIKAVEIDGKRGLSLGYECDLVDEGGEYEGIRFDCKQTNIRYNHLALVGSPRAGENARIKLDSAEIDNKDSVQPLTTKERPMVKVRVDGIEYDAAPEVEKFLTKETARADAAVAATTAEKASHDATKADRDSQKSRADALEAEKTKLPTLVAAAVAIRIDLERKATVVLDEAGREGLDKLPDVDIKKKVILAVFPDAKLDGVSEEYLAARFDSAVEAFDKSKRDGAMADSRGKSAPHADGGATNEPSDVGAAEKRYQSGVKEAYKQKTDGCSGSKTKEDKEVGSKSRK